MRVDTHGRTPSWSLTLMRHCAKERTTNCYEMGVVESKASIRQWHLLCCKEYEDELKELKQHSRFAGVGAHHQNGVAERSIQTMARMARTMMIHAHIRWPDVASCHSWPMRPQRSVYLHNHTLSPTTGISLMDLMTRTRGTRHHLTDLATTWGCPTSNQVHKMEEDSLQPRHGVDFRGIQPQTLKYSATGPQIPILLPHKPAVPCRIR
jgi:hypothetical protein